MSLEWVREFGLAVATVLGVLIGVVAAVLILLIVVDRFVVWTLGRSWPRWSPFARRRERRVVASLTEVMSQASAQVRGLTPEERARIRQRVLNEQQRDSLRAIGAAEQRWKARS